MQLKIGDAVRYMTEGYDEPRMAIVDEIMPNACIAEISVPQYNMPLKVYIRNRDIIEVIQPS
jgi:hypothetical protein